MRTLSKYMMMHGLKVEVVGAGHYPDTATVRIMESGEVIEALISALNEV